MRIGYGICHIHVDTNYKFTSGYGSMRKSHIHMGNQCIFRPKQDQIFPIFCLHSSVEVFLHWLKPMHGMLKLLDKLIYIVRSQVTTHQIKLFGKVVIQHVLYKKENLQPSQRFRVLMWWRIKVTRVQSQPNVCLRKSEKNITTQNPGFGPERGPSNFNICFFFIIERNGCLGINDQRAQEQVSIEQLEQLECPCEEMRWR